MRPTSTVSTWSVKQFSNIVIIMKVMLKNRASSSTLIILAIVIASVSWKSVRTFPPVRMRCKTTPWSLNVSSTPSYRLSQTWHSTLLISEIASVQLLVILRSWTQVELTKDTVLMTGKMPADRSTLKSTALSKPLNKLKPLLLTKKPLKRAILPKKFPQKQTVRLLLLHRLWLKQSPKLKLLPQQSLK